jgi:predicted TIM-barrel fold metal-dependent hydrolase
MTDAPHAAPPTRAPVPDPRRPRLALPPGACDCHAHVFGPAARFPYAPERRYTPPDCPAPMYVRVLRTIGCERAVIVQPSVYATDHSATLDALTSGLFAFRAVAVIAGGESDAALAALHAAGVRGARLNLHTAGAGLALADAERIARRIAPLGWHLQIYAGIATLPDLDGLLARLPVPVVIDHMGLPDVAAGIDAPGFRALRRALAGGRCWAKLSGAYRMSRTAPRYPEVMPYARALVAANPERLVWGSDWPHPNFEGPMPDDGDLVDLLAEWMPDEATRRRVLVDNPARLYGFD